MRLSLLFLALLACNREPPAADKTGGTDTDLPDTDTTDSDTDVDPTETDTTDTTDTIEPEVEIVEDCANTLPSPPAGEVCTVTGDPATAEHILISGDILGDDRSWRTGCVLMERETNGLIESVGCDCTAPPDTLVIDCPDAVISPGLINSHDHIRYNLESPAEWGDERFDHRQDWRTGARGHTELDADDSDLHEAVLYGELRMMLGGSTSIVGSISSVSGEGLARNLDKAEHNEGLGGWEVGYATFPLGDVDGTTAASGCEAYDIDPEFVLEDRIYLPHIAEGIDAEANNEYQCLSGLQAGGTDLIADNTSIVHGIGLDASDVANVSESGAQLVWSPRSNISLYGETAPVVLYDNLAVPIALGTDWTPSGSATLLRELQCADTLNRDQYDSHFSDRQLWQMVTRNASVASGADGQLGRLLPGFVADIAVFAKNGRDLHRAVIDAGIADVELVLRGSDPLTGDADVMEAVVADFASCEALDDCVSDHVVCMDGGETLASVLEAVGSDPYDLTICAPPADEPTCAPLRQDEDGDGLIYPTSSLTDADEDGVEDGADNCRDIFNPGRPLDGFVQADADSDGAGDACDACPLPGACDWRDPDSDGIEGLNDNCADVANPLQEDLDGDLLGAACDACDDYYSVTGACPESVYDVKQGLVPDGDTAVLEHMVVTAVGADGMFLQLDPDDASYVGPEYSGIYVYMPTDDQPARGDVITIEGAVADFFGQLQLSQIASWTLESAGHAPLEPVFVDPADVATGAASADALEAVLVTVLDVSVTAVDLAPGAGDASPTDEFEVEGSLRVNDMLYDIEPAPVVGEQFTAITGVLRFANDDSKLEPRDASDVLGGPATIATLSPGNVVLEAGDTASLLTVTLARAAGAAEVVAVACAPANVLTCPATVTIDVGEQSATIALTGVAASDIPATVTAGLNGSEVVATVHVYDDASVRTVVSLLPDPLRIEPDGTEPMTVTLDLPAPSTGAIVDLEPGAGLVTVPGSVDVLPGALSATFDVTAGPTEAQEVVLASLGGVTIDAVVDISAAPVGVGLLFSEYLEGSVGNNKYVEIKSYDPTPIDLSTCDVTVYSNGGVGGATISLSSVVLAQGDIFLLCNSAATFVTAAPCDQTSGSLTFNGDDAVAVSCGGVLNDVIGQIGFDPGDMWGVMPDATKDSVLRRDCLVTTGDADGADAFDPTVEWISGVLDDSSDLGNDSCP